MKTLEKMFQKNVRALVVVLMAIGLTSSLQAAGMENGPGDGPGKGKKDSVASVVKVPLKSALVKLEKVGVKKVTKTVFEDPDAVWFKLKDGVMVNYNTAIDSSNYELTTTKPCPGSVSFCGVKATNVSDKPDLASSTQAYTAVYNYFHSLGVNTAIISERD